MGVRELYKNFDIPFAGAGGKIEPTKEPEAPPAPAPAPAPEKKEQPEDKKVHTKPRSQSLMPLYVRVNVQSCNFRQPLPASLVSAFISLLRLLSSILMSLSTLQEDAPTGEDGSGGSDDDDDDDDDDEDDVDEPSEESSEEEEDDDVAAGEEVEEDEPLSLEWPDTRRKQATYLFLLPIIFPLWLTVPDVRNQVKIQTHL